MSRTVSRTTAWKSMYVDVEISPRTSTRPVVVAVSHATRASGSSLMIASRIASEIWSHILSGWPSVTDSDVKRYCSASTMLVMRARPLLAFSSREVSTGTSSRTPQRPGGVVSDGDEMHSVDADSRRGDARGAVVPRIRRARQRPGRARPRAGRLLRSIRLDADAVRAGGIGRGVNAERCRGAARGRAYGPPDEQVRSRRVREPQRAGRGRRLEAADARRPAGRRDRRLARRRRSRRAACPRIAVRRHGLRLARPGGYASVDSRQAVEGSRGVTAGQLRIGTGARAR